MWKSVPGCWSRVRKGSFSDLQVDLGLSVPEGTFTHSLHLCGYYTTSKALKHSPFSTVHSIFLVYLSDPTIFFCDLSPSFLWPVSRSCTSTSKSLHFFTQSFLSFLETCPYHLNLCRCITVIISSVLNISLNSLLENLSVT